MRIQLPPPRSWDDFEVIAFHLWKAIWNDHNAQLHGRRGQAQNGVDIFGKPFGFLEWEGVQCKGKDRFTRKKVTVQELHAEVSKAANFTPKLGFFVLATTAPRDAKIQGEAARLSKESGTAFRVSVWSWDDIEEELNFRDYLLPSLYPELLRGEAVDLGMTVLGNRIYMHRAQPLEKAFSFLSHPEIQRIYPADMRVDIRNLIVELSLNAFQHGTASRIGVTVDKDGSMEIVDDGTPYDPRTKRQTADVGVGLLYLSLFIDKYHERLSFSYSWSAEHRNILRFSLVSGASLQTSLSSNIVLFDHDALMPSHARYIARTAVIPEGYDTLELQISSMVFSPSSFFEFLDELLKHMPVTTRMRVLCGPNDLLARCLHIWNEDRDGMFPHFKGRFIVVTG